VPSAGARAHLLVAELGPILLQPSEAPDGTNFITEASGPVTVEEAAQGHAELSARWEELGFEGGDVVLFSSTAEPPSAEFALIGNSGLIFESPDAASEALEAHRTIGVPNLTLNAVDYPAEQIGDESYVFTFSAGPAGVAGAVCVFRLGNTLFIVAGSGEPVTADDLVALARIVAGRATG